MVCAENALVGHPPDTQNGRSLAQDKRAAAATLFVRRVSAFAFLRLRNLKFAKSAQSCCPAHPNLSIFVTYSISTFYLHSRSFLSNRS